MLCLGRRSKSWLYIDVHPQPASSPPARSSTRPRPRGGALPRGSPCGHRAAASTASTLRPCCLHLLLPAGHLESIAWSWEFKSQLASHPIISSWHNDLVPCISKWPNSGFSAIVNFQPSISCISK